jgi:flagellar protein FliS
MYSNVKKTYQQANFLTANPVKLVLLCYEGAVINLKLARDAYVAKDYKTKGKALKKVIDIIYELNASLDMQKGGQIAVNLNSLYNYMIRILTEADMKRDIKMFDRVAAMLEELEAGWRSIAVPSVDESPSTSENKSEEMKSINRQPAGITAYGRPGSATVARDWSV